MQAFNWSDDLEPDLREARRLLDEGRLGEAIEKFSNLIRKLAGNRAVQGAIALDAGTRIHFGLGNVGEAARYLEEALENCPDRTSVVSIATELLLGTCYLHTPKDQKGCRMIRAAARRAEKSGDPALRCFAALAEAESLGHTGDTEEAVRKNELAAKLALRLNDRHHASYIRQLRARALHRACTHSMILGRLNQALKFSAHALEQAQQAHDHLQITKIRSIRRLLFWMLGRWPEEHAEGDAVLKVMASLRELPFEAFYPLALHLINRGWLGTDDSLEEAIKDLPELKLPNAAFEPGLWILLVKGRALQRAYDDAKTILRRNASSINAHCEPGMFDDWIMAAVHLLSCYCDVEDAEGALLWYQRLIVFADDPVVVPLTFTALELGRAASLLGLYDEAFDLLSRARAITEREKALPFLALTVYELGLAHKRRARAGDLAQARVYFDDAARRFDGLGMLHLAAKARRRLSEVQERRNNHEPTTKQARALWLKLKERLPYKEIAKKMRIAVSTVGRHLDDARSKLRAMGLESDEDQIDWLTRNGAGQST